MLRNLTLQSIKTSLERVIINAHGNSFIQLGLSPNIFLKDDGIDIIIEVTQEMRHNQQNIQTQIEKVLNKDYPNFKNVRIIFTNKNNEKPIKVKQAIPSVKKIILMASAKGGVGKSTTAVNIAIALANQGFSIGIVDADIYGPTLPKLLGITQIPDVVEDKMLPIKKYNIYSISIGYIINEDQAAIWRGPTISKALYQLLLGVKWPEIDYMIIDMPPGTGDIYLTLAENFAIDGVVLITTPQDIAFKMMKKSISFFNKTNIPIIGIIENMSYFFDCKNNIRYNIFGNSISESIVSKTEYKLLGNIPIIPKISQFSDKGMNLLDEKEFEIYKKIAQELICNCG